MQLPDPGALAPILGNRGVDQVALVVEDIDATIAAWGHLLDLGPFRSSVIDATGRDGWTYRGEPATWSVRMAMNMRLPQVELFELISGPSLYHEAVEEHGYGLHHVGIFVEEAHEVDAVTDALAGQGIEVVADGGDGINSKFAYYETRPTLGCFLEMVWRPRHSPLYIERS
jgi:methylmalonyl-CoA/ethylmalonyl-CoA epimerase